MNKVNKIIGACIGLVLLTGCGNAKLEDGKELVLDMDGIKISANDFYSTLKDKYGLSTLINEIDEKMLNKEYKTTDEIKKQVESQILSMKEQWGSDFNDAIAYYYGVRTEKQLTDFLTMNIKKDTAVNDYAKTLVTDEDIEKYYDEDVVGDMEVSHILIKPDTTDDMTDEEKTNAESDALKTAKDIIKQLNDTKAENLKDKFKELAKKHSDDTGSATNGGYIGYFNRDDNMVEEFYNGSVKLEVGKYSAEPVKSTYGYHIIYKTAQKDKAKLKDIKDDIIKNIADEKIDTSSNINAYAMEYFRDKYNLKIYDAQLKVLYDDYMNTQKNQ